MNPSKLVKIFFGVFSLLGLSRIVIAAESSPNPLTGVLVGNCTLPFSLLIISPGGSIAGSVSNSGVASGITNTGSINANVYGFINDLFSSVSTLNNIFTINAVSNYEVVNYFHSNIFTLTNLKK